jgi:DNA adenine methylase
MCYQGGKANIGKRIHNILNILEKYFYKEQKLPYLEPFVGFCGVMKHFGRENNRKMYGYDSNKDIILMWEAIQKEWKPPSRCTKERYEILKHSYEHSPERGFIGIACSFGGIFYVGYRGEQKFATKTIHSAERTKGVVLKIGENIKNVHFKHSDYKQLNPKGYLIYCDPPYINNKYTQSKFFNFDHKEFWDTMRKWSRNNLVIISERTAPKDFKCIWEDNRNITQNGKVTKQTEKLFLYQDNWNNLTNEIYKTIREI